MSIWSRNQWIEDAKERVLKNAKRTDEAVRDLIFLYDEAAFNVEKEINAIVIPWIKSKTTAEQQREVNAWTRIAVTAAEQIYSGSGRGEEKKQYVLNWLRAHGIEVDEAKLEALIESAVYELKYGIISVEDGVILEKAGVGTESEV